MSGSKECYEEGQSKIRNRDNGGAIVNVMVRKDSSNGRVMLEEAWIGRK